MKGSFMLYDDERKEKLEEWNLMFVKAQPGVAKVKRKNSKGSNNIEGMKDQQPPNGRLQHINSEASLDIPRGGWGARQRAMSLTGRPPSPLASPRNVGNTTPRIVIASARAGRESPSPPTTPTASSNPPHAARSSSKSSSLHFFELITRDVVVRFLSPSEKENQNWVDIINRERDTLVTCMLLADGNEPKNADGEKSADGDGDNGSSKLSIDETRHRLREIIESEAEDFNSNKESLPTEDKGKEAEISESQVDKAETEDTAYLLSSNKRCADCGEQYPGKKFNVEPSS